MVSFGKIGIDRPPKRVVKIDDNGLEERIEILVYRDGQSWTVQIWNRLEENFSTKRGAEKFVRLWLKNELLAHDRVAKKIRKVLRAS